MDGRGRSKDNIWTECIWSTIKQEHICMTHAETVWGLRSIGDFIEFYNYKRPQQSPDKLLPAIECGNAA